MSKQKKTLYLVHSQLAVEPAALQAIYGRMSTNIQNALHKRDYLQAVSLCELAMSHCLGVRKAWLQNERDDNPQFASISSLIRELTEDSQGGARETDQVATVLYSQIRDWYEDKCRVLPGLMMVGACGRKQQLHDTVVATLAEKGSFLWQLMAALMEHLNVRRQQHDRIAEYS